MHWQQLIEGSRLYREQEPLDQFYRPFKRLPGRQDLTLAMSQELIYFLNRWRTRTPLKAAELLRALEASYEDLGALSSLRIESLNLKQTLADKHNVLSVIAKVFETIARCGARNELTGASKILHVLLPHLFVMWDARIAGGYGLLQERTGEAYACKFLPRVAAEMEEGIATYQQDNDTSRANAVAGLVAKGCGRSLPKLLDEYNFAKFTMSLDELWQRQDPSQGRSP